MVVLGQRGWRPGMRTLTRLWVLAGSLSIVSLLILGRCALHDNHQATGSPGGRESPEEREIERLSDEIRRLKLKILELKSQQQDIPTGNRSCGGLQSREDREPVRSEYELSAFSHFTGSRVYPTELGLGKRVVEKPIGNRRKELKEAVDRGLIALNKSEELDFLEGIYRTEPGFGTEYELFFKSRTTSKVTKLSLYRPYAPLQLKAKSDLGSKRELIHLVLTLSGRLRTFQGFLDKFLKIGLKVDKKVVLTVVYFGSDGLVRARELMNRAIGTKYKNQIRLLEVNETYSRIRGMSIGADTSWDVLSSEDQLLFFCDVDVVFSARFLERCRWNSKPGQSTYYPIVFSLYNPRVVYTLQGRKLPSETDQLFISRDTGYWRDFGYGMSCQYRSDWERVIGSGATEDVSIFRRHLRSGISVTRATDPGIFHLWHPKDCLKKSSLEQYRTCIRNKALNEASHAQLGLLAFTNEPAS